MLHLFRVAILSLAGWKVVSTYSQKQHKNIPCFLSWVKISDLPNIASNLPSLQEVGILLLHLSEIFISIFFFFLSAKSAGTRKEAFSDCRTERSD